MALKLDFDTCISNGCSKIIFNETTGIYNTSLNPTGWGAPNFTLGSITSASIIITLPDGTTVVTISDAIGLPTDNVNLKYEIPYTTLNSTWSSIQDGLYVIEYTILRSGITYSSGTKYFLYTCNLECCISKMFAKIATLTDCTCDSTIIKNALYASALLEGLKASAACGNTSAITDLLTKLNTICGFTTTNCGCN